MPVRPRRLAQEFPGEIDVLLTDVIMPEMTGPEPAVPTTRMSGRTKVIFTSGYRASIIGQRAALGAGVNFPPKPFTRRQLGLKIRQALDERPA